MYDVGSKVQPPSAFCLQLGQLMFGLVEGMVTIYCRTNQLVKLVRDDAVPIEVL